MNFADWVPCWARMHVVIKGGGSLCTEIFVLFAILKIFVIIIIIIIIILYNSQHIVHEPKIVIPVWIYLLNNVSTSHILCWRFFII